MTRRLILVLAASAALAGGLSGSALADNSFGQEVAMGAQMSLPPANPPRVTCPHMNMTFANFGEMVQHMRTM